MKLHRNSKLRINVIFNYLGQLYATSIGIIILPIFLSYFGGESYGLIGFFTLLQAWMSLLDLGISPTLGREVARLKDNFSEHGRLRTTVNTLETVFIGTALFFAFALFSSSEWLATNWLSFDKLPVDTVSSAIAIMAIVVSVRWVSSINRSGINAYEAQVWMNITEVIINTLRFPVALLFIIVVDGGVLTFFYYQLVLVVVEVVVLRVKLRKLLPKDNFKSRFFSLAELKRVAPFALSVAYTGAIWVVITQFDKLLLSKFLTLTEFGYFTLVATVVAGMSMLSGPVSKAILPRMTSLLAADRQTEMIHIYRLATRVVVSITVPLALVVALFPEMVIYTWTGDKAAAEWAAPILPLFALGSALLSVSTFQYLLQSAYGVLKYHVRWNTFTLLINVPLILYAAVYYSAEGVAWVWLGFRMLSLIVWMPFIHKKFLPGLHFRWLLDDLLPAPLVALLVLLIVNFYISIDPYSDRVSSLLFLIFTVGVSMAFAFALSMRDRFRRKHFGR